MQLIEMTKDEAREYIQNCKSETVLVAVKNLEDETDDIQVFVPKLKEDCLSMIQTTQSIMHCCDDILDIMKLYSYKQKIPDILPQGTVNTLLIKS